MKLWITVNLSKGIHETCHLVVTLSESGCMYTNKCIEKETAKNQREGRSPESTCQGTFNGCTEGKQTGNLLDLVELEKLHMISFLPISYFLFPPPPLLSLGTLFIFPGAIVASSE